VAIEKHHGTRKGKLTAEKAGTYWLVWDNTYSILKGKSVEYQEQYPPPPNLAPCSLVWAFYWNRMPEDVLPHHRPTHPPSLWCRPSSTPTPTTTTTLWSERRSLQFARRCACCVGPSRSWRGWWLFFQLCTATRWRNVAPLSPPRSQASTCTGGGGYGRVGKEKPSVAGGLKGRNQRRQPPSPMTCRMFSSRPRSYRFCRI
jgi:hypothetical protein